MNEMLSALETVPTGPPSEPPSILLVDDDQHNLIALSEVLSGLDARVVCASSGKEALRAVLREDFAVILLDVRMPDMDGHETAALIRQRERSRRTPLIFLTAIDKDEANVFRGYSSGAIDYVFKPVEPIVLRAKVAAFIELHKQANEILRQAEHERKLLEENLRIRAAKLEAEHQLRSIEERQALIIRSLPIALYEGAVTDGMTTRQFVHDNVLGLRGVDGSGGEDNTKAWAARVHPQDWPLLVGAVDSLARANEYSLKYRWKSADGSYRYFHDQCVVASREDGKPLKIFGTMLDVHERRMLEEQLTHAQKMDAIGQLTGGIIHDFGNMLWIIISNLELMRRNDQLDAEIGNHIDLALKGALHCRDTIKRLLGFARQQPLRSVPLDLSSLIEGLADLLGRTLDERIEIKRELAPDLWAAFADPAQMEAAIVNLVVNARDAMPSGGTLTIKTANVELARETRGGAGLPAGAYVLLEVADTGEGMTEDVLARALEPFFTTKEVGRGTGLGLSTTYGFVKQSGGDLIIRSEPGKGSTFRIYLPRYETSSGTSRRDDSRAISAGVPRARNSEVILAVEDNPDVRKATVGLLRNLGYRVFEAESGADALEALERTEGVDLLVTDLVMPGALNGYDLAREALRRKPALKVLYTSAHVGKRGLDAAAPSHPFLRKPFQNHELARAVRDALG